MLWIIKAAQCYLGPKDKLVDTPEEAELFTPKQKATDHATTWCIFHTWSDGTPIRTEVLPALPFAPRCCRPPVKR